MTTASHHITNTPVSPAPPQEEQKKTIDGELAIVLSSVALACKQISSLVSRSGISNLTGAAGAQNVQGEDQKKLDVISNDVFCNCLRSSGRIVSGSRSARHTQLLANASASAPHLTGLLTAMLASIITLLTILPLATTWQSCTWSDL